MGKCVICQSSRHLTLDLCQHLSQPLSFMLFWYFARKSRASPNLVLNCSHLPSLHCSLELPPGSNLGQLQGSCDLVLLFYGSSCSILFSNVWEFGVPFFFFFFLACFQQEINFHCNSWQNKIFQRFLQVLCLSVTLRPQNISPIHNPNQSTELRYFMQSDRPTDRQTDRQTEEDQVTTLMLW